VVSLLGLLFIASVMQQLYNVLNADARETSAGCQGRNSF